jgi:dTDP-4-amino-4,6-dideoxygalactose transaminase
MPLLGDLRPGCCPLFFPVRACDAGDLSRFLAANGVDSFRFWSRCHKAMPLEMFPLETALKSEVIALPIHQDLDEEDMAYIADLLNRWNRTPL